MSAVAPLLVAVGSVVGLARWLRVSQREHYHPGSVVTTARRWVTRRPVNLGVLVGWAVLAALTVVLGRGDAAMVVGAGALVAGVAFPVGLPLLGEPRLRMTRRATYQGIASALALVIAVTLLCVTMGTVRAMAIAPALALLAVDVGAVLNRPIERAIARKFRRQAETKLRRLSPRVVAITGSYGKTTVKNHVRDLVSSSMSVVATPASWNNEAGLSRAVNEHLAAGTEVFVAEMGTYGPGEIAALVEWIKPEIAVLTALGPVHLERMGTLDTIVRAKSEIFAGARIGVVCVDHPLLAELAEKLAASARLERLWRVGSAEGVDVQVRPLEGAAPSSTAFEVREGGERLATVDHADLHASNVACAVAAALALGVDRRAIATSLAALQPAQSRAVVARTDDGVVIIDDTFNSNPAGADAALRALVRAVVTGRAVVVTPGMVELGAVQAEANERFARSVREAGAQLVVVGWTNRKALLAGCPGAMTVARREDARAWIRQNLRAGDGVLWENDLPDHYP